MDLVPHPRNPNKHGDNQIALLAKIIGNQGWRNPIVVSERSGFIVAGHGRLGAARVLERREGSGGLAGVRRTRPRSTRTSLRTTGSRNLPRQTGTSWPG